MEVDEVSDAEEDGSRSGSVYQSPSEELIDAVYKGQLRRVDSLLVQGAPADALNTENQQTTLHFAAFLGHTSIIELLVENGASIDPLDKYGWSPAKYAFYYGQRETVGLLSRLGANLTFLCSGNLTPVGTASHEGNLEEVRWTGHFLESMCFEKAHECLCQCMLSQWGDLFHLFLCVMIGPELVTN